MGGIQQENIDDGNISLESRNDSQDDDSRQSTRPRLLEARAEAPVDYEAC